MDIYFMPVYINFLCCLLVEFNRKGQYLLLHNVLKFIIVAGVLHTNQSIRIMECKKALIAKEKSF
jgi:hypothetical protein